MPSWLGEHGPFGALNLAMGYMTGKDGKQSCPHCKGDGCWHCNNKGYTVRCPACGCDGQNIQKNGNDFHCLGCGTLFRSSGEIVDHEEVDESP